MRTNILLAVDIAPCDPLCHVSGAVDMVRILARDPTEQVIVLHVQEISIPRLARNMLGHGGGSGKRAVEEIVFGLRASGVQASGLIREADFGHVARTILDAADEFNARLIVLGTKGHTDLPRLPVTCLAAHLMRQSRLPVLIVPSIDELAPSQTASVQTEPELAGCLP